MGINYESQQIGSIRALQINGQESVGGSQLRFVLAWSIFAKRTEVYTVFGTSIWVSVVSEGQSSPILLGQAMPETAWCEESRDGQPYDRQVMYRLNLPNPQLLALEQMRQGNGLVFTLDVRGNGNGPLGIRTFDESVRLQVTVSDWVRVLKEAHAADVLLVGVHLPMNIVDPRARAAIEIVQRANEHLVLGHFSVAVAECRRAIESLWKSANLTEDAKAARKLMSTMEERISMTKRDRELVLGEALINFSNVAHHVGANAEPEIFGRLDAALAVASTASLISSLIASPELGRTGSATEVSRPVTGAAAAKTVAVKPVADLTVPEKVAKVRQHLRDHPTNRPRTLKKMRSVVESIFSKKLSGPQLDELVAELLKRKVIAETAGKLAYADRNK